jgi:hypothetical protein
VTEADRFAGDEIVGSGKPEPGVLAVECRKTTTRLVVDLVKPTRTAQSGRRELALRITNSEMLITNACLSADKRQQRASSR